MEIVAACRSVLLGVAVADALGVPVEFEDRAQRRLDPVLGMRAFGTHHQPAGTWSDDASLTFCLAESLVASGPERVDLTDLGTRFINWLRHGYMAAGRVFDVGIATRAAIVRLENGCPPEKAGGRGDYDNGNGALMRILPLVLHPLWANGTAIERQKLTARVASVTHGHPRSALACVGVP